MTEKLKDIRTRFGLTQTQAADLACVTTRAWQQYESGDRNPSRAVVELFKIKIQKKEKDNKMKKINGIKDLEKLLAQDGWTHETSFEFYASPDEREGETDIVIEVHSKLGDIEIEYRAGCMTICNETKNTMRWEDLRDATEFPSYFTLSRGLLIEGEKVNARGEIEDPCFRGEDSHEDILLEDLLPSSFTEYDRAEIDALIKGL